ncbi:YggN family protein [Vibrio sp. S4M6]|uniref:DUF2884 family protein n=1 Tax=Vibrio sinus TaxID=2946865 RepID=UPI00202A7422|nr:DUF2884 family protein [Vibrio sinus]MCL9782192.1 YggN family protein [Vibrio sinus]
MTKYFIGVIAFLLSFSSWAALCKVDLANELQITGQSITIVKSNGQKASVDPADNLVVGGKKVELDSQQSRLLDSYRQKVAKYSPEFKSLIAQNLTFADGVVDEVSKSLGTPGAFDRFKQSLKTFVGEIQDKYYKGDSLILPANAFAKAKKEMPAYAEKAKSLFNSEFVNQAFTAMSSKMNQNGGINLTEFSNKISSLKTQVEGQLQTHSGELKKQGVKMCQSLKELKKEEITLQQNIPQLKGYNIFKQ